MADFAREANRQQSSQNEALARQHEQVAAAARQLVEAESQSRQDYAALAHELQAQQGQLDRQREELDVERQRASTWRTWDSLIAKTVYGLGILAACLAPLWLCGRLLGGLRDSRLDSAELNQVLIAELVADEPLLLPGPPRTSAALPAPPPDRASADAP